jgi:ribulose bisphosphate carboxylase small subunit
VVNSAERPPEFRKPDFSLPHLFEVGRSLVGEQQRLKEMRLVEEYNSTIGNRKLGEVNMMPSPSVPNGRTDRTMPSTSSYNGQASSTRLNPEMISEINQILANGHRLGIEYVDDRRFRTNSWNCYGMFDGNGADAIAALEACLTEHSQDYIRLVGIQVGDRRRVIETIVQRPGGKGL